MLDVSIRAGVLNLMLDLRDKYRIPYLFITHDIAVARYVSDRLGVMYLGRVVEIAETDEVIFRPRHPYTQALISAVPKPNPEAKHGRITIKGEIPSAVDIPLGCRFRPRCPKAFRECGFEARDLQDHLMEEEKVDQAGHPMNKHMGKLMPKGFSLMIDVREGGSADKVVGFIKEKAESMKGTHPMFDALMTVGKTLGDRAIVVRCSSVCVTAGAVAKEFHDLLTSVVEYKDKDHPMFGRILGISLDKDKVVLEVGRDQASIPAFAKDFVRSYIDQGYDEFKAMSGIQATADKSKVIISFRDGKKPAARVAREAADVIDSEFERGRASKYGGLLLPVAVKKNKVLVRMIGPEAAWSGLASDLEKHLKDRLPGGIAVVSTKKVKGPSVTVVAKFITVEEPPLIDEGGGHQVACYLYRQAAR
jgi:oligopeptide/dipeptide ABC transporter ATP-binding protein